MRKAFRTLGEFGQDSTNAGSRGGCSAVIGSPF